MRVFLCLLSPNCWHEVRALPSHQLLSPLFLQERILANMENMLSSCYALADDLPQGNEDALETVDDDDQE